MGTLNRILGILAMLLAIVAAVLSFLLFQNRNELKDRADKLALTLADVVKTLDNESLSEVSKDVKFVPADKATGAPESGSLGFKAYQLAKGPDGKYAGYEETLKKAKTLAKEMNDQRNLLADKMAEMGVGLGVPEQELDKSDLKNLKDKGKSVETVNRLSTLASAIKNRDEEMVKALGNCGNVIGHSVDEKVFFERQQTMDANGNATKGDFNHKGALKDFQDSITNLNTRTTDYANTLTEALDRVPKHTWATSKNLIKDEKEYAGAMTNLLNDFDDINQKLAQYEDTKSQLEEKTKALKSKGDELEKSQDELAKIRQVAEAKTAEVEKLKKLGPGGASGPEGLMPGEDDPNMEGRVVQVNRDWNFVILDFGANRVKEADEFLVARGERFIARVQVSKVYPKFSLAEVLPDSQVREIQDNDRVIRPRAKE